MVLICRHRTDVRRCSDALGPRKNLHRQISTVQRAKLGYPRSRGIESTPTRSKEREDNRIHKLVLLPYKVGVMAAKLWK